MTTPSTNRPPGKGIPGQRCVVCGEPAEIDGENRQLPCGHHATRIEGVVVGWVDTGAMTLNLARSAMVGGDARGRWERPPATIARPEQPHEKDGEHE